MNMPSDQRASGRIPLTKPIQVVIKGKMALHALAINISLGGLLLSATPSLPVGSPCKLAIAYAGAEIAEKFLLEGTVIRNDSHGVAVQFARQLEISTLETIFTMQDRGVMGALASSYLSYFKVSQNKNFDGSQQLLGVGPRTFRTIFLTSFCACIPLAIILVWVIKDNLSMIPNWLKILGSFGYAATWFAIVQPFTDLIAFKYIRNRASKF